MLKRVLLVGAADFVLINLGEFLNPKQYISIMPSVDRH